ncbi:MAG TPA: tetratricopeptide repeat protein, partial [Vicinamibacteria bacterium]|nr:tetratricopeptide repeat protein [Vicinamibacteria bacterium]
DTGAIVRPQGKSADSNTDREFIEEHLAESRVFRKYGLLDKAEEQVDLVLNRYPNIFDGRFEKKEIFKETERMEEAARECLWLAGVARKDGNESLGKMLADEAQVLWPGISDAESAVAEAPGIEVEAEPPAELSLDALEEPAPPAFEAMPEAGFEAAMEPPPMEMAPEAAPAAEEEEDLNLEMGVEDEAPAEAAPAEMSASQSAEADALAAGFGEAESELEPLPALALPDAGEAGPDVDFASGSIARPIGLGAAPSVDPEIAKAVEEVDSYIALGFVDDAKDALRDALSRFPGNPSLLERASSLGLDLSAQPEPAPAAAPPPVPKAAAAPPPPPSPAPAPPAAENDLLSGLSFDDLPEAPREPAETPAAVNTRVAEAAPIGDSGGIDLGAELSALFDAQPALEEAPVDTSRSSSFEDQGLQDVFNEFKKGVDSQLGEGDYDTRYNLGIAYKEMGLVDEAIAEFQLAAKDPKRSLECSSMIGICFMEKGMAEVAVQWYERGLQVPGRAPEEYRGLRYDLGIAFEATGDLAKAKATFADLVREDPSFRDVSDKLRDLQARA